MRLRTLIFLVIFNLFNTGLASVITMKPGLSKIEGPSVGAQSLSTLPPTHLSLHKRSMIPVPNWTEVWAYAFSQLPFYYPISTACAALASFYASILDKVLTVWANNPPWNQVVFEAGTLRLEAGCTRTDPIPAKFLEDFLNSAQDAIKRGFATFPQQQWWSENADRTRLCYIGLRAVDTGNTVIPPTIGN